MKPIIFALGVMVLVFAVAVPAQAQQASVEQELIKLEKEWTQCWVKPDFALIDRILADDYTWTESSGKVITKADEIADLKSGKNLFDSFTLDNIKVRVYGDAAVVNSRWTYKYTEKGKPRTVQDQCTDTWVKIVGRWQCVAGHGSNIPEK